MSISIKLSCKVSRNVCFAMFLHTGGEMDRWNESETCVQEGDTDVQTQKCDHPANLCKWTRVERPTRTNKPHFPMTGCWCRIQSTIWNRSTFFNGRKNGIQGQKKTTTSNLNLLNSKLLTDNIREQRAGKSPHQVMFLKQQLNQN